MEGIAAVGKALVAVLTPFLTLVGLGSRRHRLRNEIRENLALVKELQSDPVLRDHTPSTGWLQGRIAIDVARLAGHPLGGRKKPIPWGSLVVAVILTLGFGYWTVFIGQDGYDWYAVFPALGAALMVMSVLGMTTNRELPASEELPAGATAVRTETTEEQVATSISLLAGSGDDVSARFASSGQVGAVFNFFNAMREGRYVDGLAFADERWHLCRVQSWLWNNRAEFGMDVLDVLAAELTERHSPPDLWRSFVAIEAAQFREVWGRLDPESMGAASRRRRLSRDLDLVILAPTGRTGGYFVSTATIVPDALTFVVQRDSDRWLVVNHVGTAPPEPGWPPTWWSTNDPVVDALPEP